VEKALNKKRQQTATQQKKSNKIKKASIDMPFFILVMILLAFGLIMLFSASYVSAFSKYGDSFYFLKKQLFAAALGVALMIFVIFLNYKLLKKFAIHIMVINIVLLILVLIIGREISGGKRWIYIGPINFQPSEISKLAVIIYISYFVSNNLDKMKNLIKGVLPCLIVIGINAGLIMLEHHLSGTILVVASGFVLLFISGVPTSWFLITGGGIAGVIAYVALFTDYVKEIGGLAGSVFQMHRERAGRHIQSLFAVGSAELWGVGLVTAYKSIFNSQRRTMILYFNCVRRTGFYRCSVCNNYCSGF
jgi:cell division protein FtsW